MSIRAQRSPRMIEVGEQSFPNLGIRYTCIDILSLTRVFWLHEQFFTRNAIFRILRVFKFFCNFPEDAVLSAQDMLHTEIRTCDGNAIIS